MRKPLFAIPIIVMSALLLTSPALASPTFSVIDTIAVPGAALASFDIGFVEGQTYFLADRSNASIDVVKGQNNHFFEQITGFVGFHTDNDHSGPNGVAVDGHLLFAGDGPSASTNNHSSMKVVDLTGKASHIIASLDTGGSARADELAIDPRDRVVVIANDADSPPFLTFWSEDSPFHQLGGKLNIDATAPGGAATDGIEQPVFDSDTGKFYVAIPASVGHPGGEVLIIDPTSRTISTTVYDVNPCRPHGAALGPGNQLLLGCSNPGTTIIINKRTGGTIFSTTQVGGSDEAWFNPGDNNYYLAASNNAGGPVLGVISADGPSFVTTAPTGAGAHSVAADAKNNHIFVPLRAPTTAFPHSADLCGEALKSTGCIAVFAAQGAGHG